MPTLSELLGNARTIAIVVHGVGDHSLSDIVDEAKRHLSVSNPAIETVRHEISDLPQPQGTTGPQSALEIVSDGARHFVLPVRWDSTRSRINKIPSALGVMGGPLLVATAIPALALLVADMARCIPRAQGWWRLAVALLAVLLTCLIMIVAAGVYYFFTQLPIWMSNGGGWSDALILVILALGFLWMTSIHIFDFVGDVVGYVSHDDIRESVEDTLNRIIQNCAEATPGARILVIGHSLGSVLASHMLLRLPGDRVRKEMVVLLTLGSPLRAMAKVFPAYIHSPAALLEKYRQGNVSFWANLWRDRDFIGRALAPGIQPGFAEMSLGDGPHWNYWDDGQLWRRIVEILRALDSGEIAKIGAAWSPPDLTAVEEQELSIALGRLNHMKWGTVIASFIALTATCKGVIWSPWPFVESAWTLAGLRTVWLVELLATFGALQLPTMLLQPRTDRRAWLAETRFMIAPIRLVGLTALAAATIILVYEYVYGSGG